MEKNNGRVLALSVLLFVAISFSAYSWVSAYRGEDSTLGQYNKENNITKNVSQERNNNEEKCSQCDSWASGECGFAGETGNCANGCNKDLDGCSMHQNK